MSYEHCDECDTDVTNGHPLGTTCPRAPACDNCGQKGAHTDRQCIAHLKTLNVLLRSTVASIHAELKPIYTDDTVRSCDTCPFSYLRSPTRGYFCAHPKYDDGNPDSAPKVSFEMGHHSMPEWCPLKEGPVLVRLAKGA